MSSTNIHVHLLFYISGLYSSADGWHKSSTNIYASSSKIKETSSKQRWFLKDSCSFFKPIYMYLFKASFTLYFYTIADNPPLVTLWYSPLITRESVHMTTIVSGLFHNWSVYSNFHNNIKSLTEKFCFRQI